MPEITMVAFSCPADPVQVPEDPRGLPNADPPIRKMDDTTSCYYVTCAYVTKCYPVTDSTFYPTPHPCPTTTCPTTQYSSWESTCPTWPCPTTTCPTTQYSSWESTCPKCSTSPCPWTSHGCHTRPPCPPEPFPPGFKKNRDYDPYPCEEDGNSTVEWTSHPHQTRTTVQTTVQTTPSGSDSTACDWYYDRCHDAWWTSCYSVVTTAVPPVTTTICAPCPPCTSPATTSSSPPSREITFTYWPPRGDTNPTAATAATAAAATATCEDDCQGELPCNVEYYKACLPPGVQREYVITYKGKTVRFVMKAGGECKISNSRNLR
ncbi:MAG: hypothetical protein KVP17_000865 [Porospora cf. gigantea B]|uniref:uncharacterized protein n=1 Tax=Porospora cf. gigantea B TaxID=2853592 RepID=UPI003571E23A|nr:MAG: hypothetical protein KVP17_000865 [Porospora cf. gigantea B]